MFGKVVRLLSSTWATCLIAAFTIVTVFGVFVPFNPKMPGFGLDPSWQLSMNEGVAKGLVIGKDLIFTYGPYASIYTQAYHPAIDHLMIFGSMFLALCYSVVLLYLSENKKFYSLLVVLFFFVSIKIPRDTLFFSYPLLLAVGVSKSIVNGKYCKNGHLKFWQLLIMAIIFAPLGLLPLIKGSLVLICGANAVAISLYLLYQRQLLLVLIALLGSIVSAAIFWQFSGQAIAELPHFFRSMSPIISGYTEAMAVEGSAIEIAVYLVAVCVILWSLAKFDQFNVPVKVYLIIIFALFLFVAFKAGFVRHDGHEAIASNAIIFAALLIGFIHFDKRQIGVLFLSFLAWFYIEKSYTQPLTWHVSENIRNTYGYRWNGLRSRITGSDNLQARFEQSLDAIRKEFPIPALAGSTDIYSYHQAYLLASNNKWNPRPIMQSYSVYTQELAQINEQHLRNDSAPDNVLFAVQPIDGRLPALEDGLSWPALFDNYTITKLDNNLAYLRKKQVIQRKSTFDLLHEGEHKIGEEIALHLSNAPVFAEVSLKSTLLGRLLGVVFKPPQLEMQLRLKDGTTKDYRVLANMMEPGFIISPLVQTTRDFVFLGTGNQQHLKNNIVDSISIVTKSSQSGSLFWNSTYTLKLKTYRGQWDSLPENFIDSIAQSSTYYR